MTKKQMIATLAEKYPNFTKVQACMISHPERYGIGLTAEAQQYLQEIYPETKTRQSAISTKKKRKPANRKKGRRLVIYVDDDEMAAVKADQEASGCKTMQEYLTSLIRREP